MRALLQTLGGARTVPHPARVLVCARVIPFLQRPAPTAITSVWRVQGSSDVARGVESRAEVQRTTAKEGWMTEEV